MLVYDLVMILFNESRKHTLTKGAFSFERLSTVNKKEESFKDLLMITLEGALVKVLSFNYQKIINKIIDSFCFNFHYKRTAC